MRGVGMRGRDEEEGGGGTKCTDAYRLTRLWVYMDGMGGVFASQCNAV